MSRYNPSIRYDALIGYHYDWVYGGHNRGLRVDALVNQVSKRRLIDQVNKKVNGKYLPGGDWIAWQRNVEKVLSPSLTVVRPAFGRAYQGSFELRDLPPTAIPSNAILYGPDAMADLIPRLESLGAEGYARARPAAPTFSAATSLLEMKDLPGMFKQSIRALINRVVAENPKLYYSYGRNAFFKKDTKTRLSHTAEWYLALEFGWLPIIKGIQDYIKASNSYDVDLKQLLRDEGKEIRRRRNLPLDSLGRDFVLPPELSERISNPHYGIQPVLVTQCYPSASVPYGEKYQIQQKAEFVACFKYWLPEGPRDKLWSDKIRSRMLGGRVTPSVAWNLMPWTFLVDYFSTLGKAIENLGPGVEDQLYTKYCYVTYREDLYRTVSCGLELRVGDWDSTPKSTVVTHREHSKLRVRVAADPFAFRFKGGGPSLKQQAILTALATSRF